MKRNRRVAIGCSLTAAICFGIVSYGDLFRGRISSGCVFAILAAVQLAMALVNGLTLWKEQEGTRGGDAQCRR